MAIDPVCEMLMDEEVAVIEIDYNGDRYYFCSISCSKKFQNDPKKYVEKKREKKT